jgi:endogenous inhibitor of DNA gyrase (YacG/DUF329 family)
VIRGLRPPCNTHVGPEQNEFKPWCDQRSDSVDLHSAATKQKLHHFSTDSPIPVHSIVNPTASASAPIMQMETAPGAEGAGDVMAVIAPSSGVVALETEMIDGGGDAALIHMLPEEMLLMVFAWVDTETLLRAVHAVCRSWRMAMSGM